MDTQSRARPTIAEIIRAAGTFDGAGSGSSDVFASMAAIAATMVPGASAAQIAIGEAIGTALSERFHIAQSQDTTESRDYAAPYETVGRALILALHAVSAKLGAAFDTATGSALEAKIGLSLMTPEMTLTVVLTDVGPTAVRLAGKSHHAGLDWLKLNAKTLDRLFASVDGYLTQLGS
jgi:hypothetical protein